MSTPRNACFTLLAGIALSLLLMPCAVAQARTVELNAPPLAGGAAALPDANGSADDQWHIGFLPYLWFAGVHGTTGVRGFNASVHASPGDLLSHFNIGLMGALEMRRNRVVLPVDTMWIRLSDSKSLPGNVAGVNSIDMRVGQFVLSPKAGYRIIDGEKLKVDGLAGLRYWHLGQKLNFNPTIFDGVSTSQNWVDALGGGRIQMLLSPKASITIAGDAGGGGASPDYQVLGLLGFKVKNNVILQAGWRYLDVHYRNSGSAFLYDVAQSGAAIGATIYFK
ncbi:MAG TPA: hypothetical protein VK638_14005 [Edaphobacter sp.]|nr:hypothetical protein [Edaphobacter sp.]